MAKARTKASVRDRAVAIWRKENDPTNLFGCKGWRVRVQKSRSKKIIRVSAEVPFKSTKVITWSYEGGNLKRLSPAQAAGKNGLSACISEIEDKTRLPHSKFGGYAW